ncbi:TRAP transporter small permease protein [Spirochaetia bacterium]|nr:TRAP transporter small permease protein [Spirochaetia bacterium]
MNTLNKISGIIEKIVDVFLIAAFMTMTAAYFSGVVARYVFNLGIPWAEELTRYLNVAMVMLGSSTLARYGAHTNITVLELAAKGKSRKAVKVFQQILTILFFSFAARIGVGFAATAKHISSNMRMPMSVMYYVMSLAFALLAFQTLVYTCNLLSGKEGK